MDVPTAMPRGTMGGGGLVLVLALGGSLGCERGEPPAPDGPTWIGKPEASGFTPSAVGSLAAATATAENTPSDPALLPQTRDIPHASGHAFDGRVAALWDAIVHDTPDVATAFFFPLDAYRQVKDVADPASDWRQRLLGAYRHDIHVLHGRLRDMEDRATLVGLEVNESRPRWVEPGEEWNKIGYFRVFDSKLRYRVDGEAHAFDVKSLISWRGEWYLVHLSAIK